MIKAVFFDVDGTLISHNQNAVPTSTRRALAKLNKKGIKRIVATGRHMLELSALPVKDIAFDAYITLNGQLCLDGQRNVISGSPIIGLDKERIIQLFIKKSIPVMLIEREAMYINFINHHVEAAQQAISTKIPEVGSYTGNEIYQAVAYLEKGQEKIILSQLSNCMVTRWNMYAVDIISNIGGKTSGIIKYLCRNNILQKETMAFGDGENDIAMLKFVQIGVAMGNADRVVKENADFITASVDDDGIEKALINLKII